jgi:hypothetical protein
MRGPRGGWGVSVGSPYYGGYYGGYGRGYYGYPGYYSGYRGYYGYPGYYGGRGFSVTVGSPYYGWSYSPGWYGGSYYSRPFYSSWGYAPVVYSTPGTYYYSGGYITPTYTYRSAYTPSLGGPENGAGGVGSQQQDDTALINVLSPPNAEIWFNGDPTTQTGMQRQFVTPPLKNRVTAQ